MLFVSLWVFAEMRKVVVRLYIDVYGSSGADAGGEVEWVRFCDAAASAAISSTATFIS